MPRYLDLAIMRNRSAEVAEHGERLPACPAAAALGWDARIGGMM